MAFDPVAYIMDPDRQQIRLGLERIEELLARMGNPERGLKYVHVAGTNGKGSTCSFIDAALREAGYHVGLFTSPHLIDFKERICVDGRQITDEELYDVTLFVKECADELFADRDEYPTEFELMTAVGFEFFARQKCDRRLSIRPILVYDGRLSPSVREENYFAMIISAEELFLNDPV